MRLILAATPLEVVAPLDQWVLYSASGYFNILPYVNAGYNTYDAYIVGGGGGGGGGGNGFASWPYRGGGGGGGGGGGSLRTIIKASLALLPANGPVTVGIGGNGGTPGQAGTKGGNSSFNGLTAYGGGAGGSGSAGASGNPGTGGGGGSGGGRNGQGANGTGAWSGGAAGGGAVSGGGAGGQGASLTAVGKKGSYGTQYADATDHGGGGGGGGGRGTISVSYPTFLATVVGGIGGDGYNSPGGRDNGGSWGSQDSTHFYGGGNGAGGGGGINLALLAGYSNLYGRGGTLQSPGEFPGGGGPGGAGDIAATSEWRLGKAGGKGCVLIRVYVL